MSGFETNLATGIAAALAAEATIGATWNTTGAYTSAQTGITLNKMPTAPDRIICLTTYGVSDAP
jgi:hypothetical protein